MTPEELKKIALEATKSEYEAIMKEMEKSAKNGEFSCEFLNISDGARNQLQEAGFIVEYKTHYGKGTFRTPTKYYYLVRFAEN